MIEFLFYIVAIPALFIGIVYFRNLGIKNDKTNFFLYGGKKVRKTKLFDSDDSSQPVHNGKIYDGGFVLVWGVVLWVFHEYVF